MQRPTPDADRRQDASEPRPGDLIDQARQADILAVAQHYGAKLKRASGGEYVGPCPVCGGRDRFSVNVRKACWNCRGCSRGGDVIALVEHITGAGFAEAVEILTGEAWPRREINERASRQQNGELNNGAPAGRIWRDGVSIRNTVAEHYLVLVRGIDLDQVPELDDVMRFHPACPFGGEAAPCLIALVRDVASDAPKAIVRTALAGDGHKIGRKAFGPIGHGAIKLWPDASITTGLVIGEGLETVAAAATRIEPNGTRLQPAWSLIDAGNLRTFPVLAGIEALTILVDNDYADQRGRYPGQEAARQCTQRWLDAGCDVAQPIPRVRGADFNDLIDIGELPL